MHIISCLRREEAHTTVYIYIYTPNDISRAVWKLSYVVVTCRRLFSGGRSLSKNHPGRARRTFLSLSPEAINSSPLLGLISVCVCVARFLSASPLHAAAAALSAIYDRPNWLFMRAFHLADDDFATLVYVAWKRERSIASDVHFRRGRLFAREMRPSDERALGITECVCVCVLSFIYYDVLSSWMNFTVCCVHSEEVKICFERKYVRARFDYFEYIYYRVIRRRRRAWKNNADAVRMHWTRAREEEYMYKKINKRAAQLRN